MAAFSSGTEISWTLGPTSTSSLPDDARLKFRMDRPRASPIWGSFPAPKTTRMMTRTMISYIRLAVVPSGLLPTAVHIRSAMNWILLRNMLFMSIPQPLSDGLICGLADLLTGPEPAKMLT